MLRPIFLTTRTPGKQRAAAFTPHTEAPANLSQLARRFPESRLHATRPQFSWGSTIITTAPFVCPVAKPLVPDAEPLRWVRHRERGAATGQTKGAAVIMVLPQENWGRVARRCDSGKRRAGWDRFAGASVCGESRSPLFPRRPGSEENGTQQK